MDAISSTAPHRPCQPIAGRPRAAEREARTDTLIATAAWLFMQNGYGATSLSTIARAARVAVRTIYVKFGGKAGLLQAIIERSHEGYRDLLADGHAIQQPLQCVLRDFSQRFLALVLSPNAIAMQRAVIAEAHTQPELAQIFYRSGLAATHTLLANFFARTEIRAQLRADAPLHLLPVYLINCIVGDHFQRFLCTPEQLLAAQDAQALEQRLSLFYRAALIQPSTNKESRCQQ